MNYAFDWSLLWGQPYGALIVRGIRVTFYLSLIGWAGALALGTVVGFGRTARAPLVRGLCTAYVEMLRNVPLLVQLFFWYFALPALVPRGIRVSLYHLGWETGSAIVALALYTSSRVAEHVRSGLRAVASGVGGAALSTGLSAWQAQRYVIAPLVFRLILPGLTSEFLTIFKSSSLAMTVGVAETTYVSQQLGNETFHWIEANAGATLLYLGMAWVVAGTMSLLELRVKIPGLLRRASA